MEPYVPGNEQYSPGAQSSTSQTVIDLGDVNNVDTLGFYNSAYGSGETAENYVSGYEVSGTMNTGFQGGATKRNMNGPAGRFLENKGFGWLLDVEDDTNSELPLLEELDIDLKDIYYKVRCVLLPLPYFRLKLSIVRESPDFWGPLLVVIAFALLSIFGQLSVVSWILTIWFCGSFLVFFLARALGGEVSYSQVLGIVGYCLLPLVVTGLCMSLFSGFKFLSFFFGAFGITWAVYSAGTLLCVDELASKRPLLLYPVFLLYIYFFSLYHGV